MAAAEMVAPIANMLQAALACPGRPPVARQTSGMTADQTGPFIGGGIDKEEWD